VIPAYNQRARTRRAAEEALQYLHGMSHERPELIIVDDGSDPGAGVEAAELPTGAELVALPRNLGKGGALRAGIARTRGDYVIFTDSDLPFALDAIPTTLAWLREGADIVIGDRLLPESQCDLHVTPMRRLSSMVFTFMVKGLCGLRQFDDTQCGYKGYRGDVARRLFADLEITSFAFDVEILLRALKAGYRVRRQPLRMVHNEDSSVRLSRHAPRMMRDTLLIAARNARGHYG
jgi:dolichyl-phosphate beta-glucosyltransferase